MPLSLNSVGQRPRICEEPRTWLVFLALLPLINAVFDFVSMGLTRWLLRSGATAGGF